MAKFTSNMDLDLKELLEFIRKAGAPTIKEIKIHFATDSRSTRRALGKLMAQRKLNIIVVGGPRGTTYWMEWPEGKKGAPNPNMIRAEAARHRADVEAQLEKVKKKLKKQLRQSSVEVDFERE
jgi:hypothetical protein